MSVLFIILVGLTMTIFSKKMLISHRCIRGLMPNLIKKSWMVSNKYMMTINSSLFLAVHHNCIVLGFHNKWLLYWFYFITNVSIGLFITKVLTYIHYRINNSYIYHCVFQAKFEKDKNIIIKLKSCKGLVDLMIEKYTKYF